MMQKSGALSGKHGDSKRLKHCKIEKRMSFGALARLCGIIYDKYNINIPVSVLMMTVGASLDCYASVKRK